MRLYGAIDFTNLVIARRSPTAAEGCGLRKNPVESRAIAPERAFAELLGFTESVQVLEPAERGARLPDTAAEIVRRSKANRPRDRTIFDTGTVAG
jgi:hypothetical protein